MSADRSGRGFRISPQREIKNGEPGSRTGKGVINAGSKK
jgi:hypothetical protein